MTLIKIQKSEHDELVKKCKEQELLIREQDVLIERLSFEIDVMEGWKIHLSQKFFALEIENFELLIQRLKLLKIPDGAPSEEIARHKDLLNGLQQNRERACKKLIDIENGWKAYTSKYPAAAEAVISRKGSDC